MQSLLDQVRHWATTDPDRVMVREGDRTFTYGEMFGRARQLAGGLARAGVHKGDRVAVLLYNQYRWYDLYYGAAAAGCALVPINYRLAPAEIAYQLDDSGCKAIVYEPDFAKVVQELKPTLKTVRHFVCTDDPAAHGGTMSYEALFDAPPMEADVRESDVFGIYYTGGTTGLAKGVVLSHKAIVANAMQLALDSQMRGDHVAMHAAPMFHLADGAVNFTVTLVGGSHVSVRAFDPVAVFECIERYRVTLAFLVPTMINVLINHPAARQHDLKSMRSLYYGASPIAPEVLQRAMALFGCEFSQVYGMTEAGPILTVLRPEDHRIDPSRPESLKRLRAAGRPIIGVRLRVVNVQGKDVAIGEVGEVIAKGDNLMTEYWAKPAETSAVLDADGWYHTRDLAERDAQGYVYIVDRAKDMIISGAENIYTVEVEAALYKHPAVIEAAVIGVPDQRWGEAVKACVVLRPGATASSDDLIAHCKTLIASYKCPKSVDFLDALPKSAAGKMLKRELRRKYWKDQNRGVA
jgi:long-chain acyl-CoA synthetase